MPSGFGQSPDRSFPRVNRLRGRTNFLAVLRGRNNRYLKGRFLQLYLVAANNDTPTQFGIAIARKAGPAPSRNRIKRVIREFLRNNKAVWPSNTLMVIRVVAPVADETAMLGELEDMLKGLQ